MVDEPSGPPDTEVILRESEEGGLRLRVRRADFDACPAIHRESRQPGCRS